MPSDMLSLRLATVALTLGLVASVGLAQTGEADPPSANTVPGSTDTRKPQPVMTLQQKIELLAFCRKDANRTLAKCKGLKDSLPVEPTEAPES